MYITILIGLIGVCKFKRRMGTNLTHDWLMQLAPWCSLGWDLASSSELFGGIRGGALN